MVFFSPSVVTSTVVTEFLFCFPVQGTVLTSLETRQAATEGKTSALETVNAGKSDKL